MKIHEKIRAIRKEKGVTQTHVANSLSTTVSNYSMKENGKRTITVMELELIAQALEVPTSIFFENEFHVKLN